MASNKLLSIIRLCQPASLGGGTMCHWHMSVEVHHIRIAVFDVYIDIYVEYMC